MVYVGASTILALIISIRSVPGGKEKEKMP